MLWHYTTGINAAKIVRLGVLLPHPPLHGMFGESDILWFSENQVWEPLCGRETKPGCSLYYYHPLDHVRKTQGGVVRFSAPEGATLPQWPCFAALANLEPKMVEVISEIGIEEGANPLEWYAMFREIPIDGLTIQRMAAEGEPIWQDTTQEEIKQMDLRSKR